MKFILIVALIVLLIRCWFYKCFCEGLIFFAIRDHDWNITEVEMKKILEYSLKRNIKDFNS